MVTGLSQYNSGTNGGVISNWPSGQREDDLKFKTSTITPELYDMKSNYQLIKTITKFSNLISYRQARFEH